MNTILKILVGLGLAATTVWGFRADPAAGFMNEDLARILFWHLPFAFITTLYLLVTAWQSFKVLRTGSEASDIRAEAAAEITLTTGVIVMLTGILFSKAQWGAWWNWDPRQTSFLFVLLILCAYFAIRAAFSDPAKRAANSAAYCLAALLPILFLIFALPRLMESLHPNTTLVKGDLKGDYWRVVLSNFVLFTFVTTWLFKMRVRVGEREAAQEAFDGKLDDGGGRAPTGVVRPLSLSDEN